MSDKNKVEPEHLLEVASISAHRVLKKFFCLRLFADEVESESLLAATMAYKYYPTKDLLFTWGLIYAAQAIVDAMRRQKWLPGPDGTMVRAWSTLSESFEDRHGYYSPPKIDEADIMRAKLNTALKPREADMVWRHLVMDETFKSIGDRYKITHQAVQQMIKKSVEHLQRAWAS